MKIAILDFDNTLYDGFSRYDTAFELEKMGVVAKGLTKEIEDLQEEYESGQITYNQKFADDKKIFTKYYQGLVYADLCKYVNQQFDLEAKLFDFSKELVQTLQDKDYIVVLVSGAWDFILDKAQDVLNVDSYFGTEFSRNKEGFITDGYNQILDFEQKKLITAKLIKDAEQSVGIGDSAADVPILNQTDISILIDPKPDAAEMARIEVEDLEVLHKDQVLKSMDSLLSLT